MRRTRSVWTALWISVVTALAASFIPSTPAAAVTGPITALAIDSPAGEWAGGGLVHVFTPDNATIVGTTGTWMGSNFSLYAHDDTRAVTAAFWPPTGQGFAPGTFEATHFPTETTAGLDVSSGGGCSEITGEVTIHDVVVNGEGIVEAFAATFKQRCDGGPAVFGEMRFNSSVEVVAASHPSSIETEPVLVSQTSSVGVSVASGGTMPLGLGQATIAGPAADDWSISADGCSNGAAPAGSTCAIELSFAPTDVGLRSATLTIPDGTARGERRIELIGSAYRLRTTVVLTVSSRTVRFGRAVRLTAHLNQFESMLGSALTISATPYHETDRVIASGSIDAAGDLTASFRMRKKTTFVATFAGDAAHQGDASPGRVVDVRPIAAGTLSGSYATSGKYRLYRFTTACPNSGRGCPTFTAKVIPAHPGARVYGTLQVYVQGTWQTALTFRMRLNETGKATTRFVYADRRIIGVRTRVHFRFAGDADHLAATSNWSYFKVTS